MRRPLVRRPRRRGGFTIIEVVVSIMIMVVGVLGLASTAAVVQRLIGSGAQQTIAANAAQSRFERMRSLNCALMPHGQTGTATGNGLREWWRVDSIAPTVRVVSDSVIFISGRRNPQLYRSMVTC
jgi:Tfp pilus assembly protein PilV